MKIRMLIAQADELLDRSKSIDPNVYQKKAIDLRRNVLDEYTRFSLSNQRRFNSLYSEIENKVRFRFVERLEHEKSQVEGLVRNYYEPGLLFLKSRLELAAQLLRRRIRRLKHRPKGGFRLPSKEANSKGRARTISLVYTRLKPIKLISDGEENYRRVQ